MNVKMLQVTINLPDNLAAGIGRLMVHWSFQLWLLAKITHTILGVDPKQGRIAVRDPRPEDYVTMIQQLIELKGFTTTVNMNQLREDLRELKTLRDSMAHGIYSHNKETGHYSVQVISGTWKPDPEEAKRSRRETPEAKKVTVEGLESVRVGIVQTILPTQKLLAEIEKQVSASQGKRPQQSGAANPPTGPTSNTPPAQRRSSQG